MGEGMEEEWDGGEECVSGTGEQGGRERPGRGEKKCVVISVKTASVSLFNIV
jgi:hypothetical protein